MAKYIPPFKKEKEKENQDLFWSEPTTNAANASNRWARDSNFKPRTSFDSRSEPRASYEPRAKYEPRTLFEPKAKYESKAPYEPKAPYESNAAVNNLATQANKMQLDDFPSLPQKKPQQQQQQQPKGRMTYASLAANWAEQVKENEEKAKKAAEEEEEKKRLQEKLNEVKIVKVSKGVIPKKRTDSDDDKECDIGCHVSDNSSYSDGPDNYDVDVDAESEQEEEEEDPDAFWTQRKNRNELY